MTVASAPKDCSSAIIESICAVVRLELEEFDVFVEAVVVTDCAIQLVFVEFHLYPDVQPHELLLLVPGDPVTFDPKVSSQSAVFVIH